MSLHEGCFRRGGVCDCGARPCALPDDAYLTYKAKWRICLSDGTPIAGAANVVGFTGPER